MPSHEMRRNVEIWRCLGATLNKDIPILRLLNLLSLSVGMFASAIRRFRRGDIVIVTTNPPSVPLLMRLAARTRGARCLLLVHDVYPDVLVASGWLKDSGPLVSLFDRLQKSLYRSMDRIIVIGRDMAKLVTHKSPGIASRVVLIPNWADVDDVQPSAREENLLEARLGLNRKFVVQYSGNMGRTHQLESIVQAADELRQDEGIHFLFIGSGAKRQWLEETVAAGRFPNITILPYQERSQLRVSLTACDAAIVTLRSGMAGISVPSRLYNILAAGRPILAVADADSELAQVVREESVGWIISPGDVQSLSSAIREARDNPERLRDMGIRARAAAEGKYAYRRIIADYETLLSTLSHSG